MPELIEQISPDAEHCTRCVQLNRDTVINAGEPHWAVLRDGNLDSRPRVIMCGPCKRFVRQVIKRGK